MSGINEAKNVNGTPSTKEQEKKDKTAGVLKVFTTNALCDGILDKVRELPTEKYFSVGVEWAVKIGAIAFKVAAVAAVLAAIVLGIRADSIRMLLLGILVAVPACLIFSYIGSKLFHGVMQLIRNFPSRFTSRAFPDCIALVSLFAAVAALLVGILFSISERSWFILVIGLVTALACGFLGLLAATPKILAMEIVEISSPAEELIGIMSFNIKAFLLTTPFIWGVGSVLLVLSLLLSMFMDSEAELFASLIPFIILGLLPLLVYLTFLAFAFSIDFARAILSVPGKLDALKK